VKKHIAIVAFLLLLVLVYSIGSTNAQLEQPKKYIAFRDDDIAPFTSLETLKAVNQVHIDENVPVTLGIIPHPREGQAGNQLLQDEQFLTYMRSIAVHPLFEFAQHGYSHNNNPTALTSEFTGLRYNYQYNLIFRGQADIKEAFGVTPTTFIPPWNNGDRNTTKAAAALGFTEYSAGFSLSNNEYGYTNGMRMEGSLNIGGTSDAAFSNSIKEAKNLTERFLANPQSGDTLGVTYHAKEFTNGDGSVDSQKLQQLTDFIHFLKTKGVLFTRLDRSSGAEYSAVASPSSAVGFTPSTFVGAVASPSSAVGFTPSTYVGAVASPSSAVGFTPSTFVGARTLLPISSIGIALFGIYYSAQLQRRPNDR